MIKKQSSAIKDEIKNIYNNEDFYNKLLKRLTRIGVGSRVDCEKLITEGNITINGKIIKDISYPVAKSDNIFVKKKKILNHIPPLRLLVFNKPKKCIVSKKDQNEYKIEENNKVKIRSDDRISVFDIIGKKYENFISIGRLDFNTEGLLLFTNCGEFARKFEHPDNEIIRVYNVKVFGHVNEKKINKLKSGVKIDGVIYNKFQVFVNRQGEPYSFLTIKITEGKNHEIKKALKYCGLVVVDLRRIQYGVYKLNKLRSGEVQEVKNIVF